MPMEAGARPAGDVDAIIVGAGLAGLYMLHRLRELGFSARVYEAGNGVGGTWYWNRYPGARCDVESMDYSYSFSDELQQEWKWTERYASQPEILRYINHVADRFDLRCDVELSTRVTAATFDEATGRWTIQTDRGDRVAAQFCIMATGCLSTAQVPPFKGIETFAGKWYHTGHWPHDGVDFTGQRVGVIGTGSSAIQSIPLIARQAASLVVFQRTPNFSVPAHNAPLDPEYERRLKADYAEHRRRARESRVGFVVPANDHSALAVDDEARQREYETRWNRGGLGFTAAFADLLTKQESNDTAAEFFRAKIRAIVRDPAVAEALVPKGYPIGTKRMCVDTNYYDTFNRDNVTPGGHPKGPDRSDHPSRSRDSRRRVRAGQPRVRDGLRCDDRRSAEHRHSRHEPVARCGRSGPRGRAPIWASRSPGSRTSSPSPVPAARP